MSAPGSISDPLTVINLDLITAGGCQTPGCKDPLCGTLHLAPKCCRRGVVAAYKNGSGVIVISCFRCGKFVSAIKVAE